MLVTLFAFLSPATAQDEPAPAPADVTAAPEEDTKEVTRTWALDPTKSTLTVLVKYDRGALIGGHDHILQATTFEGSVVWNTSDLSACDVRISFPVTALEVDPEFSRERAGLEGLTSDGDRTKIRSNALGKHQLQSSLFPSVTFQSKSCTAIEGRVRVTGDLSIHGVSKSVSANMKVATEGDTFTAKGTFSSTHTDWGMDPFTAALGALRNADPLQFHVNVTGGPK